MKAMNTRPKAFVGSVALLVGLTAWIFFGGSAPPKLLGSPLSEREMHELAGAGCTAGFECFEAGTCGSTHSGECNGPEDFGGLCYTCLDAPNTQRSVCLSAQFLFECQETGLPAPCGVKKRGICIHVVGEQPLCFANIIDGECTGARQCMGFCGF